MPRYPMVILLVSLFLATGDSLSTAGGKIPPAAGGRKPAKARRAPGGLAEDPARNFSNYKPLATGIANAEKMTLFVGLTRPWGADKARYDEQRRTNKTVRIQKFDFYAAPAALKDDDARQLKQWLLDEKSFREMAQFSAKGCGGFHPDFDIEFRAPDGVYHVQLCFGCHEMKIYGPRNELYCDIESESFKAALKLLTPYFKNPEDAARFQPVAKPENKVSMIFGPEVKIGHLDVDGPN